jgi:hypothetical protein
MEISNYNLISTGWVAIKKAQILEVEVWGHVHFWCGRERAIIAIARTLRLRARRMLLGGHPYVVGLAAG